MNKLNKFAYVGIAAVVLAIGAYVFVGTGAKAAPESTFVLLDGSKINTTSLKGKVTLVNFWATWCPPCVEELPLLDGFWRENAANGFQVLALAIDQPSAVRKFLQRQPLGFPVGLAGLGGTELAKSLGNATGGLPFSVFFKADGSIWRQKLGQLSLGELSAWRSS